MMKTALRMVKIVLRMILENNKNNIGNYKNSIGIAIQNELLYEIRIFLLPQMAPRGLLPKSMTMGWHLGLGIVVPSGSSD